MRCVLLSFFLFPAMRAPVVETQFVQVAPAVMGAAAPSRSPGQLRAVVLIHGMYINPLKKDGATRAVIRTWQQPGSLLVSRLARDADVFAFAYSQTVPADELAEWPDLTVAVGKLRRAGYRDVVLVGYSAGGVIAREIVEDHPNLGVTKVVQVCAPNAGTSWARLPPVRRTQSEFQSSLTKQVRTRALLRRGDRRIPDGVQFACVVGTGGINGDGLVNLQSQWSDDLQRQGVPAYSVPTNHWQVMRTPRGAELIADLVRQPLPRWDGMEVSRVRQQILREPRGKTALP